MNGFDTSAPRSADASARLQNRAPHLSPRIDEISGPDEALNRNSEEWTYAEHGDERLDLDAVLASTARLLILGGAGAGKSTVLRCLALELIEGARVFEKTATRYVGAFPLLVPFSFWVRRTIAEGRPVGLDEILTACFGHLAGSNADRHRIADILQDDRVLLLIDGIDEFANEAAARTTLMTLESFLQRSGAKAILSGRPDGVRRLGTLAGDWDHGTLLPLTRAQQAAVARAWWTKSLSAEGKNTNQPGEVERATDRFFRELSRSGRLAQLAAIPLILCGALAVALRRGALPADRFHLFDHLIDVLLNEQPRRREVAAYEIEPRFDVFATEDRRRECLAVLAFHLQSTGADAGITRNLALSTIQKFLSEPDGLSWNLDIARRGALALVSVNADTTGLVVERAPDEIGFCHASLRDHLAGFHLSTWPFQHLVAFARTHAWSLRWHDALLSTLHFLRRPDEITELLSALRPEHVSADSLGNSRALAAEAACLFGQSSGRVAQPIVTEALDRIEDDYSSDERARLLGIVLDTRAAGPILTAVAERFESWAPTTNQWRSSIYQALGAWMRDAQLERVLWKGLFDDDRSNRVEAAKSLSNVFRGTSEVADKLETLIVAQSEPEATAVAIRALRLGWPDNPALPELLRQACTAESPEVQLSALAGLVERGETDVGIRNDLLALASDRFWIGLHSDDEIIETLAKGWAADREVHDACWRGLRRIGGGGPAIEFQTARRLLYQLAPFDERVGAWVAENVRSERRKLDLHGEEGEFLELIRQDDRVRQAVSEYFEGEHFAEHDQYEVAHLAPLIKTNAAKTALMKQLRGRAEMRFWPVKGLLDGWGMQDDEVAVALENLANEDLSKSQYISEYLPEIISDRSDCRSLLLKVAGLKDLQRPDFLLRGLAKFGATPEDDEFVSALLSRVPARRGIEVGVAELITTFYAHPRVKEFALEKLQSREPPIAAAARVYERDSDIRPLILKLAAPLPSFLRRLIGRRAEERPENPLFKSLIEKCDFEVDSQTRVLLSIALAYSVMATESDLAELATQFSSRLVVVGPDYTERRLAASVALMILNRFDLIATAVATDKDLLRNGPFESRDRSPEALGIIAEKWDFLEDALRRSGADSMGIRGDPSMFWDKLAPHVWRSESLQIRFVDFCGSPDALLSASILSALSRIRPRSRLLFDACRRTMGGFESPHRQSPLDGAAVRLQAAILLAEHFSNECEAAQLLGDAAENAEDGLPLVGLGLRWPESGALTRHWLYLKENERNRFLWPSILAAAGSADDAAFLRATTAYLDREIGSPWDFPNACTRLLSQRMGDRSDFAPKLLERIAAPGTGDVKLGFAELYQSFFGKTAEFSDVISTVINQEKECRQVPRFAMALGGGRRRPLITALQLLL